MPVLPLVGSIIVVTPGLILPAFSAASIIAKPMRSFTLETGFWLSSLATTVAGSPAATRFNLTSGVCPISSVTSAAMRAIIILLLPGKHGPGSLDVADFGSGAACLVRKSAQSGANRHRSWHQGSVSDIDAWQQVRPEARSMASVVFRVGSPERPQTEGTVPSRA